MKGVWIPDNPVRRPLSRILRSASKAPSAAMQPAQHPSRSENESLDACGTNAQAAGGAAAVPGATSAGEAMEAVPRTRARLHATFQLWLVVIGIGTLVGSLWLTREPAGLPLWLRVYTGVSLVSSIALLALVPGALLMAIARWVPRWGLATLLQAHLAAWALVLLYSDTVVFRLMRYHMNGAFVNLVTTEGSGDALHLGAYIWLTAGVIVAGLTLAFSVFLRWRARREDERSRAGLRGHLVLQPRFVMLALLLPLVVFEKGVWAAAEWTGEAEVLHATRSVPGLKLRPSQVLDDVGAGMLGTHLRPEEARLAWPAEAPVLPADGPRPDLFLCVLDSWRADAFHPDVTPSVAGFAAGARVFHDHLSSGNATRFGLLGMLYGLHGAYWGRVLEGGVPPVLVTALQSAGYEVRVFSAASMSFPEFRLTAWSSLDPDAVVDRFDGVDGAPAPRRSDVKDTRVADAVEAWLAARDPSRPYFCFVLLDAPHQPYFNPGGPFQPALESLNYIELGTTPAGPEQDALREEVHNTYLNAVHHSDREVGRMLRALEAHGDPDRGRVTLLTGDHGEEFGEHGYWGHTSNFTPEQVRVPFLMAGPGIEAGAEHGPTSHLDVSNTLLELLGADPAQRGGYSLGQDLLAPPAERDRAMGSWAHMGLWTASGIFSLPLEPERDFLAVMTPDWRLHPDREARFEIEAEPLRALSEECLRFLAPSAR